MRSAPRRNARLLLALMLGAVTMLMGLSQRAGAGEPSAKAGKLDSSALRAEFDAAGASMEEELACETQGDFVGAAIASRSMQEHRARFLDLQRARIAAGARTLNPFAVARNPFAPDSVLASQRKSGSARELSARVAGPVGPTRSKTGAWDMYVPQASASPVLAGGIKRDGANALSTGTKSWGMYEPLNPDQTQEVLSSAPAIHNTAAPAATDREPPTTPFFVYRSPVGGGPRSIDSRQQFSAAVEPTVR